MDAGAISFFSTKLLLATILVKIISDYSTNVSDYIYEYVLGLRYRRSLIQCSRNELRTAATYAAHQGLSPPYDGGKAIDNE